MSNGSEQTGHTHVDVSFPAETKKMPDPAVIGLAVALAVMVIVAIILGALYGVAKCPVCPVCPMCSGCSAPVVCTDFDVTDGTYAIQNVGSDLYLTMGTSGLIQDVDSAKTAWKITRAADHSYTIVDPDGAALGIDVSNLTATPSLSDLGGISLSVATASGVATQNWLFGTFGTSGSWYTIELASCLGVYLLDVTSYSTTAGAVVHQWNANGKTNQQWRFVPL